MRAGTFVGTHLVREDVRDTAATTAHQVSGRATWRLELDTLDWRRKVTVRLLLPGPDQTVVVIRTAGPNPPQRWLTAKNMATSHADPRYFTATISALEHGRWREFTEHDVVRDTISFLPMANITPGATLRGTISLLGFAEITRNVHPLKVRIVQGAFAAAYDSQPEPPRTMTPAEQKRVMHAALYDFAIH
jgi:hypothetical protein